MLNPLALIIANAHHDKAMLKRARGAKVMKPQRGNVRSLHAKRYSHVTLVGCPSADIEPVYTHKALGTSDGYIPDEWFDHLIEYKSVNV